MKNRHFFVLMEQIIMTAVFAFCVCICLSIFVHANKISERNTAVYNSAFAAQNMAELLKHTKGNIFEDEKWQKTNSSYHIFYDKDWNQTDTEYEYMMEISEISTTNDLSKTVISVYQKDDMLFSIPVVWQEVQTHE